VYAAVRLLFGSQNSFKNFAEIQNGISWQSSEVFKHMHGSPNVNKENQLILKNSFGNFVSKVYNCNNIIQQQKLSDIPTKTLHPTPCKRNAKNKHQL